MEYRTYLIAFLVLTIMNCSSKKKNEPIKKDTSIEISKTQLDLDMANQLSQLAFHCIDQEYPNRLGQTIASPEDLKPPQELRPAFYGCFDWHSAVHGHWTLVRLLKSFPDLDNAAAIKAKLTKNITPENIKTELKFWDGEHNKSFERTYGWAWLLKLQDELLTWDDPLADQLSSALSPMAEFLEQKYIEFLPRLNYPIRVGEHSNTAFGLTFAMDYAMAHGRDSFLETMSDRGKNYYSSDQGCPLNWEPSGYDFLSPCLEEAHFMSKALPTEEFRTWWESFLGDRQVTELKPAESLDLTDGKLVHLVGLNFSRAWCLFDIGHTLGNSQLISIAETHINDSMPQVVNGDYAGEHWLASFAVMALTCLLYTSPSPRD